jgi:recombination protein RecA
MEIFMNAKPQVVDGEKAKALQAGTLAQIERQFGKGTIMRLGEGEIVDDIQVVSYRLAGFGYRFGRWRFARGRVIEIYGAIRN